MSPDYDWEIDILLMLRIWFFSGEVSKETKIFIMQMAQYILENWFFQSLDLEDLLLINGIWYLVIGLNSMFDYFKYIGNWVRISVEQP